MSGLKLPKYTSSNLKNKPFMMTEGSSTHNLYLRREGLIPAPKFFKQCRFIEIKNRVLVLQIPKRPSCATGDGCFTNVKGCKVMKKTHGFNTPWHRCNAHKSDGSLKRLATSRTFCVQEVVAMACRKI